MPWKETTHVTLRREFVSLALQQDANISELCRRYGISRKTGYKWLNRFFQQSAHWEQDRPRRPHNTPGRIAPEVERAVIEVRDAHPAWGGRKIRKCLERDGCAAPPAPSTITAVLRRHERINPLESKKHAPMQRFERPQPNELWQMDFKGHFPTLAGACHPLTIVDDHSRFAVCVAACAHERQDVVQRELIGVFRMYGMPVRILMDNGSCWKDTDAPFTRLTAWMLRLGIRLSHARPYHPQTNGKNERFNRTLKAEAITGFLYSGLADCQKAFDRFRACYNHERPHEALGMETPSRRYRQSPFEYPETLPPFEYLESDVIRKIGPAGYLSYRGARYHVGRAFSGDPVALRATEHDGLMAVYYCSHQVAVVDLHTETCFQHRRRWPGGRPGAAPRPGDPAPQNQLPLPPLPPIPAPVPTSHLSLDMEV